MKKIVFATIILTSLYSCNKTPQLLTSQEIKRRADSITAIRIRQMDEQAKTDLEYRMKIEVKVKVDSIINARLHAPADTAKKAKNKMPAATAPKPVLHRAENI